jgi:uncharacterized protein
MQTNGTIITQQWCDLIIKYDIKVGISIDGPREVNDASRKTRNGRGTFDKIMEGIAILQQNNIPYHAIAVLNEKSLYNPDEFFDFFYNNGFYELGLNIEEVEGIHKHSSLFEENTFGKLVSFFSRIFDLYKRSDGHMAIREFDRCMEAILREPGRLNIKKLSTETQQNIAMLILSVDYMGNFSTFSPELIGQPNKEYANFIFGNIFQNTFSDIKQNKLFKSVQNDIDKGIQKCKAECDFFYVCGGGAPANKFFENGSFNSSETNYCRYNIKIPTELILSYLEEKLQIT